MPVSSIDALLALEEFFHDQAVHESDLVQIQDGVFGLRQYSLQSLNELVRIFTGELVHGDMHQRRVSYAEQGGIELHVRTKV
jgi:hypothetical protein